MTVTVFTGAWGEQFKDCIPGWWDAVLALDPAPDEVLLVHGEPDLIGLSTSSPRVPFRVTHVMWDGDKTVASVWNHAIRNASGDWLVPCPIDDRLTTSALRDIPAADAAGADIIVDAIQFKSGAVWQGQWIPEWIGRGMTLPTMAPFKKSLADRMDEPFPPIYYSDWGFYMNCAVAGAVPFYSQNIRMIYTDDLGVGRESDMVSERKAAADQEAAEYAASLGLTPAG